MEQEFDFSIPHRQPVKAIIQALIKSFGSMIKQLWPILIVILLNKKVQSGEGNRGKVFLFFFIISLLVLSYNLFEFFYLRYMIRNGELVIKKGFFVKREVVLPFERIQAVHLDQDWLQRLMGVVKVTFDSPGTTKTEERIFLEYKVAEQLRDILVGERTHHAVSEQQIEKSVPVISLDGSDLFKLGISANFLRVLLIMAAFAFGRLDDLQTITGKSSLDWVSWLGDEAAANSAVFISAIAIGLLLFSMLTSFILVVLKYGNFQLTQSSKGFHIRSGLINTREKLVPYNKIQFISWNANWIRRFIPFYLFHFHIIGDHEISNKWKIGVPATRLSFFPVLLQSYHPQLPTMAAKLYMHPDFLFRQFFISLIVIAAMGIAALVFDFQPGWKLLFISPVWMFFAYIYLKNFSVSIAVNALQINHTLFSKSYSLVRWDKVVSVVVKQSIFQRRRNLATVTLFTGGGSVSLPYISLKEAGEIRDYALYKSETAF